MPTASKQVHRCGVCGKVGHRRETCPRLQVVASRAHVARTTQGAVKPNKTHVCSICGRPGHRRDTCPLRSKTNRNMRVNVKDVKTAYREVRPAAKGGLKKLKQIPYPTICAMTDPRAKRFLDARGLLPAKRLKRTCWKCAAPMNPHRGPNDTSVRCTTRWCRTQLRRTDLAHTPLWDHAKGGRFPFAHYLRAMYQLGTKTPLDSACHHIGCSRDAAKKWYSVLKLAIAFAELYTGCVAQYPAGTLEFDGTKTLVSRSDDKTNVHLGRFLICFHRESGSYSLRPIDDGVVLKGAPPPPETFAAAEAMMSKYVHKRHVVATDAAGGLTKASKAQRKAKGIVYTYVIHRTNQFVKVLRIPLSRLTPEMREHAMTISSTNKRFFRVRAGINLAEAAFSAIKRNLTRMNLSRSPSTARVNFLSAAWLSKNYGLEGVIKGVRLYQSHIINSKTSPMAAFKNYDWLEPEEIDQFAA